MKNITNKRQFFWSEDSYDKDLTTARLQLSDKPIRREKVMDFNEPWESENITYMNFFYDEAINKYRMYYCAISRRDENVVNFQEANYPLMNYCYAESDDGFCWVKPSLGIHKYKDSYDNNIIMDPSVGNAQDNFFVYKDTNPDCPSDERYKMIGYDERGEATKRKTGVMSNRVIVYWKSADGIHFEDMGALPIEGFFDTHNTVYWDEETKQYFMFFRDFHRGPNPLNPGARVRIRDVMFVTSKDFKTWNEPQRINTQTDSEEIQMYTNGVIPYYRGPHMWVGFPTRYYEYGNWLPNFDYMPAKEQRMDKVSLIESRMGLALTDCTFMCSENKDQWYRFEEAYYTPGPETKDNWFYGCCYPAIGMFEAQNDFDETELSMLMPIKKWVSGAQILKKKTELYRYSMRVDGFACMHADNKEVYVQTNPFCFEGENLEMNFRTSAGGFVYVSVLDENGQDLEGFKNAVIFGDSLSRPVVFEENLAVLQGKPVRLKLVMKDADVFSYRFY